MSVAIAKMIKAISKRTADEIEETAFSDLCALVDTGIFEIASELEKESLSQSKLLSAISFCAVVTHREYFELCIQKYLKSGIDPDSLYPLISVLYGLRTTVDRVAVLNIVDHALNRTLPESLPEELVKEARKKYEKLHLRK